MALWFQPVCVLCEALAGTQTLCSACALTIRKVEGPWCGQCGTSTAASVSRCGDCLKEDRVWKICRSLFWLNDTTRPLIHRIKYGSRLELLHYFRPSVAAADFSFFPNDLTVVPVPLHWRRWARRGFNQAEVLASWIAKRMGWNESDALKKTVVTPAQSLLTRRQRQGNLRRAFTWKSTIIPSRILLVDDVFTTGATLKQCARVLKRAGCEEVYAWTLFRAPRPGY